MDRKPTLAPFTWFDPQLRANDSKLAGAITLFRVFLETHEIELGLRTRRRTTSAQRGFELAVEAACCNLVAVGMVGDRTQLALPLGHKSIWGNGVYSNPVYGQHFLDVVQLLELLGFVERLTTGYKFQGGSRAPSLFRRGQGLARHLPVDAIDWRSLRRELDGQLIVLKGRKNRNGDAPLISYRDSKQIKAWRRQIERINKWLASADVELLPGDCAVTLSEEGDVIAPFRKSLHRTFNNGNWQHGGRLSGGFWMSMKREDRFSRIRINGQRIADVDYEQLYPYLAYVRAQAILPEGDFYDVLGDQSFRKGWKVLTNALLFAEDGLGNWPRDSRKLFPSNMTFKNAVELVRRKHRPIADLFGRGLGFQLMRIESDVLISVVTHLFKRGVPVLPLHDALLAARSDVEIVKAAMEGELELRTGIRRATVKIEFS